MARGWGRICLVAALVMSGSARLRGDQYHAMNAGAPVWNGVIQFTPAKAAAIAATGCRAVRVNFRMDGHATWDASLLAAYDTVLQTAANNQLAVLGLLSNECMPVGQIAWNDDPDGDGMNSYVTGYAQTALLLVDRYKHQIKKWEIWNEPSCWSVDPSSVDPRFAGCTYFLPRIYANLLAETYKTLNVYDGRRLLDDHQIALVSGGLLAHDIGGSFSPATNYMGQVYDRTTVWNAFESLTGRRYPWTLFGYHFYLAGDSTITTSKLNSYFNAVRNLQAARNDPAPMYITEFGWNSASAGGESGQANNLNIAFNHMETRSYILGAFWYQWVDEPYPYYWGLTRGDGSQKSSHGAFTGQQSPALPPPEPQVSLAADTLMVGINEPVTLTPSASYFPGVSGSQSQWHIGTTVDTINGTPAARQVSFGQPGTYPVYLVVRDTNRLAGRSNTLSIQVSGQQFSPADFDTDTDVDIDDFAHMQACLSGPAVPQTAPECDGAHFDQDNDVDANDLAIFLDCLTGAGLPVDPACGT